MGGSSSVMGMWALRGMPEDYDGWANDGAAGWGWKDVLPYFNRLESDQDFKGPLHGDRGPIPIRREPREKWSPLATAVYFECLRLGIEHIEDSNSDFRDGHCVLPNSRFEHSRGASGICYLTAEVRARPNLTVLSKRTVNRSWSIRDALPVSRCGETTAQKKILPRAKSLLRPARCARPFCYCARVLAPLANYSTRESMLFSIVPA